MTLNVLYVHTLLEGAKYTPESADMLLEKHLLPSLEKFEQTVLDFSTPYPFTHPIPFLDCLLNPLFSEYNFSKATLIDSGRLVFIYTQRDKGVKLKKNISTILGLAEIRGTVLKVKRVGVSYARH